VKRAGALATGVASSALLLAVFIPIGLTAARPAHLSSTLASANLTFVIPAATSSASPSTLAPTAQPAAAQPQAAPASKKGEHANRALEVFGLLAIFVGIAGFLAALALNSSVIDARDSRVRRRLSFYTLSGRASRTEPLSTALGDSSVARSAVQIAGRLVGSRDLDVRLGRRLDGAGVPLKPAEWIVVQVASAAVFAVLFGLLGGGSAVAAVLGLLIGIGLPIGYLVIKEGRRTTAFLEQLPDTLQLIAGSLTVGHSLAQAMDAVVREERQPVSIEFNRALVETRLGMPVEDALEGISSRMVSQDFAWIVMAIRIQREVGGNLAEILTTVAATIRERERLRRQVRGLSAEGRLSAWILGGLPPLFATYLILVRPTYIKPLFTDPIGVALLAVMIVLMVTGVLWLSRIVKVEV